MLKLVQFLRIGNAGIIELDRPDALNALNIEMVELMAEHLKLWQKDETVGHVIICSSSDKAFCSGGDVRQAVSFIKKDPEGLSAEPYFRAEYSLDVIIATYSKPIISLVNGVVMGGGLGLCRNGSITVVSETIKCAMPETAIGLFPDVGASLFLRLPGVSIGLMLGMTGQVIGAGDAIHWQIADRCVPFKSFDKMKKELCFSRSELTSLENVIAKFEISPPKTILAKEEDLISKLFQGSVIQIVKNVKQFLGVNEYVKGWYKALSTRCPTSIHVIHHLLSVLPPSNSLSEALHMDFQIACKMMRRDDFSEGVRAVLIDKDHSPIWSPDKIEFITENELENIFKFDPSLRLYDMK